MSIRISLTILLGIFLVGCDREYSVGTTAPSSQISAANSIPQLDSSTPDRALKSYWAVKDFLNALDGQREVELCAGREKDFARLGKDVTTVMGWDVLTWHINWAKQQCSSPRYGRQIEDVKTETESRAVAIATITDTRELEGVEPDEGEQFKYVLEKEGANWRVTQVFQYDKFELRGTKWRPVFEPSALSRGNRFVWANRQ